MSLINLLKKKSKVETFTTPSHAQNFFIFSKLRQFYKYDISETDAHNPQEALASAQKKASDIYGTKSTFFLTNGSSSGVLASVLTCVGTSLRDNDLQIQSKSYTEAISPNKDKLLIWKDSHPSHQNAAKLAGAVPVFYELEKDEDWGIHKATNPDVIESILKKENIKAVIITSPTYEGVVSDIASIKEICKKYGSYLIVDEAHGALYPFCDKLPKSAISQGADFVIQSLHKTAGGLNPTALLHCNVSLPSPDEGEGDFSTRGTSVRKMGEGYLLNPITNIEYALSLISTTSPSYPLLASIEKNITFLNSQRGKKKILELVENIEKMKKNLPNCQFFGDDITKILVKIPNLSGFELSEILFEKYNIEDEITNEKSSMLLTGIGTDLKKLKKLELALKKLSS